MQGTIQWNAVLLGALFGIASASDDPSSTNRTTGWMQYATSEEAGFSSEALEPIRESARKAGSAAVFVVYKGNVLAAWGEVERPHKCHSVRKSLLSALYGTRANADPFDLNSTIGHLGIDDITSLTDAEKQATVRQLLQARSGIYHPAAKETSSAKRSRPERGSHAPGTHFYYNNWDFNLLGVIYRQWAGVDLFDDFQARLARPLGMEDYDLAMQRYELEPSSSMHSAYAFRMSARDLARVGVLYAYEGMWNERQLVPATWVRESTRTHSETDNGCGYGYMWWTYPAGCLGEATPLKLLNQYDKFAANGTGGQFMLVIPEIDLVFVHMADTFYDRRVRGSSVWRYAEKILAARIADAKPEPALKPLDPIRYPNAAPPPPQQQAIAIDPSALEDYVGVYVNEPRYHVRVHMYKDRLFALARGLAELEMFAAGPDVFFSPSRRLSVTFGRDASGAVIGASLQMGDDTVPLSRVD